MTEPSKTMPQRSAWDQQQIAASQKMCSYVKELVRRYGKEALEELYGTCAAQALVTSLATGTYSKHWHTIEADWGTLLKLLSARIPTSDKDGLILCPGPLKGGTAPEGTRKIKENVERLDLLIFDYDKGDAPIEKLAARMEELEFECAMFPTFSHDKSTTKLPWAVTRQDPKTGTVETVWTAFQTFTRERLAICDDGDLVPTAVTGEIARAFMVEQQDFDDDVLGEVDVVDTNLVETKYVRGADGQRLPVITSNIVVRHRPIAKTRLVTLLSEPFVKLPGESTADFQERWKFEVYDPVGAAIGFKFDPQCSSTERGHYAIMSKEGADVPPLRHIAGKPLDLSAPETEMLLAPFRATRPKLARKAKRQQKSASGERSAKQTRSATGHWNGFQAADAAADLLPDTTDKRTDVAHPLVAFPCPFVHEHATSNNPTALQCYAYNASRCDWEPTVKCQSATCEGRPNIEFLEALFPPEVQKDPRYRIPCAQQMTGCIITKDELEDKLREVNETWALVRAGGRTRYLHENEYGELELYDKKSAETWFANWRYLNAGDGGKPKLEPFFPLWNCWEHRRQYRGIRFCPNPNDKQPDIYNTYRGFSVEPRKGRWDLLLGHIYRNICQRNPEYFRFFIAWLAQLVQQPHIKPGTNIVLRGKEGVGKSKLGEWIVKLFGHHALVVSESERITGRFNAHLENKLLMLAEEAFWAGDKAAEGKLKDLATGMRMSYERKGLDPYEGDNYTRIMIASNEEWVVPASSGGRRWFVLEVGDGRQKDYAYFAAIDEEMADGGLEAMLYDLLHSKLPEQVNVRSAPQTPWLVEQRLHSYDNRLRWVRSVVHEGGFRLPDSGSFVELNELEPTAVNREDIFESARRYFAGPKGVDPGSGEIGRYLSKIFGKLPERRRRQEGSRRRDTIFPPLKEMREKWAEFSGEVIGQSSGAGDGIAATDEHWPDEFASTPAANIVCTRGSELRGLDPDAVDPTLNDRWLRPSGLPN